MNTYSDPRSVEQAEAPAEEKSLAQRSGKSSMARKRRGRRTNWSRYMSGSVDVDMILATLNSKTAIRTTTTGVVVDTTKVSSIKCTYILSGITPADNKGPLMMGVCHPDYTTAELEEWIEADAGWDIGDKIAKEIRGRLIRVIGVFNMPTVDGGTSRLNDGLPVKTKLNWVLAEGDGLTFWSYNLGSVDLDGSANINVLGKANLWYQ